MDYLLILIFVFFNSISPAALRPYPSDNTPPVSMYDMCLESDIRQIDELKDSLLEDFNRTSPNFEELKQLQLFGLLDEDWKRLGLLESRLPDGSILKSKLVIVFRILLAAIYQAYGQGMRNKGMGLGKVSNERTTIEQEIYSLPEESLNFNESRSDNVFVNAFNQATASVDVSAETAATNNDKFAKYDETATSSDSIILPEPNLNSYFKQQNRSTGSEERFFVLESHTHPPTLPRPILENINGSNNSSSNSLEMNTWNTFFKQPDSPMLEAVHHSAYPTSQKSNSIFNHVNGTPDSFVNNQVFEWTDETKFSITTILNEVRENNFVDEHKYERPNSVYGDSNSSEIENNTGKTLTETKIGDPTGAASDTIYSFINFTNFNYKDPNTGSNDISSSYSTKKDTYTTRDSPNKEENFIPYNYIFTNNPHKPASDSVTSMGSSVKQEGRIDDSKEDSNYPLGTSDSATSTSSSVKQEGRIEDSKEDSNYPLDTSVSATSTGSSVKQEGRIEDSKENSNHPLDTSDSATSTSLPVKLDGHIGDSNKHSNYPFYTSDGVTSTGSSVKQEGHIEDINEYSNYILDTSNRVTSTGSSVKQEGHIGDSNEHSNYPFYTSDRDTSTGSSVKPEGHIGDSNEHSNYPFYTSDRDTSTGSSVKQEGLIGDSNEHSNYPFYTSDRDTSTGSSVKQEGHIGDSNEHSNYPFSYTSDSDSATSTGSSVKQEGHIGDSNEHSNYPFYTIDRDTSTGSSVKQEGYIGDSNEHSNYPFDTSDRDTSTGSSVKQEGHIGDSNEHSNYPFSYTSDSDSATSTGSSVIQEGHIGDSNEHSNYPFYTIDRDTSTGSSVKQEGHIGDSNEHSNYPFYTSDRDTSTGSSVKQEGHIGDSNEHSNYPFSYTSDSDSATSTGSSVKQEGHIEDSNEHSNIPYNSASDTFTSTANFPTDLLINNKIFQWRDEMEAPASSVLSEVQEEINVNEENSNIPNILDEGIKSKDLEDNSDQTSQEYEVGHPTEAASGVIYSFVNFSNFNHQKSNENSIESNTIFDFTSRFSTPAKKDNFLSDSYTPPSNPYEPSNDTITLTDSPVNSKSYIWDEFQPSNKPFTSEMETTYSIDTIKTIHEKQDSSEVNTNSDEDENKHHHQNHKSATLSTFGEADINVDEYNQPTSSLETRTLTSLQEINPSSESNLKEHFKDKSFGFSEYDDSGTLESTMNNDNLLSTTISNNLVISIEDYLGNQYLGSYNYVETQSSTQTPLDIPLEDVDSNLGFAKNTSVFQNYYKNQKPIYEYTTIKETAKNSVESNLFNNEYHGELNEEIDSKLVNSNEMLTIIKNKQRSSIEEQEFDQYENSELNGHMKYSPSDQEIPFSVEDERHYSSTKYKENVINNHDEKDLFDTLNYNTTSFSGEESIMKYNTNHGEILSNSSKVSDLSNNYKDMSNSNEDNISYTENVNLQNSSEEPKINSLTNFGEHIKDSQNASNRTENPFRKEEGIEAYNYVRQEYTSESTNVKENNQSRNSKNPNSSKDDKNMRIESLEEEDISPTSADKSIFIQPQIPDQTHIHSSNTEPTVYRLDSNVNQESSTTVINKFLHASTEKDEPFIDFTKANGENHSDEESKENHKLMESHVNLNQSEIFNHAFFHPGTSDDIDPSKINCTLIKPVHEGKESDTETTHSSFATFSIVLTQEEHHETTESSYDLKIYPAFEQPYKISNNCTPRKDCGNTNNYVQVKNIEYMPNYDDYKSRRDTRNSKEVERSEVAGISGKYLLSRIEDEVWKKKMKALENQFDELFGPPENST